MKKFGLIFLFAITLFGQPIENGFNFFLPSYDSTKQNFLPYFPKRGIQNDEFVSINTNGHFEVKGKRINFWGSNICDEQVFPAKKYAGQMVGRIRKFGFNLMRFHYFDGRWGDGRCIFPKGDYTRDLDKENLDRMEFLISKMKDNGIYINMNLHVARKFSTLDGVVDADSLVDFGKAVTLFDPQLIELQKEYARQLLTHVNPYTGLALVDDPVMAMLEITNENWLFHYWNSGAIKPIKEGGILTVRHNKMLEELWNDYLVGKYGTTEKLEKAWSTGSKTEKKYIPNGDFEDTTKLPVRFNIWDDNANAVGGIEKGVSYNGTNAYKIIIDKPSEHDWQINLQINNLTLEKDSTYVLSFYAKSNNGQKLNINIQNQSGNYQYYRGNTFELNETWKKYTWSFKATETNIKQVEMLLCIGNSTGEFWIDEICFDKTPWSGLLDGESLEKRNIKRMYEENLNKYSENRAKAIIEFLISLQEKYYTDMSKYLKDELGVKVPISGSNFIISFADTKIQNSLDYLDQHAYWDHPWNDRIVNNSMINKPKNSTIGYLFGLSAVQNKPFTISEYSHVYPNRYQTEFPFFLAAYGSFQEADAVMSFGISEGNYWGEGFEKDMLLSNFNIGRNNVIMSFMPTFAYAFRNNLISPSQKTIEYSLSNDDILNLFINNDEYFFKRYPKNFPKLLALTDKVRIKGFNSQQDLNLSILPSEPVSPFITNTGEITWNENGYLKIETGMLNGLVGFLDQFPNTQFGNMKLIQGDNFAGITLMSLDNKPILTSEKMILTVGTRQLNTGTVWNSDFTSLINKGTHPTIIEPVKVILDLTIDADSLRVVNLDTKGQETDNRKIYYPTEKNKFTLTIDQKTEKSLWFGIETKWVNKISKKLSVLSPKANEVLIIGNKYNIEWNSIGIDSVNIYYKLDNSENLNIIAQGLNSSDNNFLWSVPSVTPDSCIIIIEDSNDSNIVAHSQKFYIKNPTKVGEEVEVIKYRLEQNYPNPFNPSTNITYSIPQSANVKIVLFDALGKKIKTLIDKYQERGTHVINFRGYDLPSGIYFYSIETLNFKKTKKMMLLK